MMSKTNYAKALKHSPISNKALLTHTELTNSTDAILAKSNQDFSTHKVKDNRAGLNNTSMYGQYYNQNMYKYAATSGQFRSLKTI